MLERLHDLLAWLRSQNAGEIALYSIALFVVMFTGSLAFTAWIIVQLPATYFLDNHPHALAERHPAVRWLGLIAKNVAGVALILLGVLLSLPGVPGQGALTILIGLMMVDFPGKRRLERKLVARPAVRRGIDRLRARFGKPPLVLDKAQATEKKGDE